MGGYGAIKGLLIELLENPGGPPSFLSPKTMPFRGLWEVKFWGPREEGLGC